MILAHMCGELLLKVYGFGRVVRTSEITHVKQSRDYRGFEVIAASTFASHVGNALRDISKKFPDLVAAQLGTWSLQSREVKQVHSLASKFIK